MMGTRSPQDKLFAADQIYLEIHPGTYVFQPKTRVR